MNKTPSDFALFIKGIKNVLVREALCHAEIYGCIPSFIQRKLMVGEAIKEGSTTEMGTEERPHDIT